jgi:hypothetical protein
MVSTSEKIRSNDLHAIHSSASPPPINSLSTIITTFFGNYGYYLSSRQIPFLLFSSIIICSLLFPSVSLYFSPDGPASQVARRGRGSMVWELEGVKRQGLISSEAEICWDRLAQYYERSGRSKRAKVIRMEQILVTPSSTSR